MLWPAPSCADDFFKKGILFYYTNLSPNVGLKLTTLRIKSLVLYQLSQPGARRSLTLCAKATTPFRQVDLLKPSSP